MRWLVLEHAEVLVQIGECVRWNICGSVVLCLEQLTSFGLGGALQMCPAFSHLFQLLLHHGPKLWLLLDQILALLDTHTHTHSQCCTQSKPPPSIICGQRCFLFTGTIQKGANTFVAHTDGQQYMISVEYIIAIKAIFCR